MQDCAQDDKEDYLKDAEERVKFLTNPDVEPFVPFKSEFETYKRNGEVIRTGNKVLPRQCNLCGYRSHCWSNAQLHDKVTSKAKSAPRVWYDVLKKKTL